MAQYYLTSLGIESAVWCELAVVFGLSRLISNCLFDVEVKANLADLIKKSLCRQPVWLYLIYGRIKNNRIHGGINSSRLICWLAAKRFRPEQL